MTSMLSGLISAQDKDATVCVLTCKHVIPVRIYGEFFLIMLKAKRQNVNPL